MEHDSIQEIRDEIVAQMAHIGEPLFTSKASHNERHLNACLHVMSDNWDTYAEGYRRAGDIIVEYVDDNGRDQDLLVYPIGYLYRHYLELRLKELQRVSTQLLGKSTIPFIGHDIMKLWSQVRVNIDQDWLGPLRNRLEAVEERLKELYSIDQSSDAFRYPESIGGSPSLGGMREINLRQFRDTVGAISFILDGISYAIGEYIGNQA